MLFWASHLKILLITILWASCSEKGWNLLSRAFCCFSLSPGTTVSQQELTQLLQLTQLKITYNLLSRAALGVLEQVKAKGEESAADEMVDEEKLEKNVEHFKRQFEGQQMETWATRLQSASSSVATSRIAHGRWDPYQENLISSSCAEFQECLYFLYKRLYFAYWVLVKNKSERRDSWSSRSRFATCMRITISSIKRQFGQIMKWVWVIILIECWQNQIITLSS